MKLQRYNDGKFAYEGYILNENRKTVSFLIERKTNLKWGTQSWILDTPVIEIDRNRIKRC